MKCWGQQPAKTNACALMMKQGNEPLTGTRVRAVVHSKLLRATLAPVGSIYFVSWSSLILSPFLSSTGI
jgi:hypothetical protein